MKTFRETKRALQRGATLTGYALTLSAFAAAGLSTMAALEEQSGEFLTDTGNHIGEARPDQYELETTILAPEATASTASTAAPSTTTTTAAPPPPPPSSSSTTAPPLGPTGNLIASGVLQPITDGLCLVIGGDNKVRQQSCDPTTAPPFNVHERDDGYVTLSAGDGTCLGATGGVAPVTNQTCTEDDAQLWTYVPSYVKPDGTQTYNLLNKSNGKCLDVSGNATNSGAELITWSSSHNQCKTSSSANNHQFTVYTAPTTPPTTAAPTPVLSVNASNAVLSGNMTLQNGQIGTANNSIGNNYDGAHNATGSATFTFTVTEAGNYQVQGSNITTNGGSADSFWAYIDGQPGGVGYKWFTHDGTDTLNNHDAGGDVTVYLEPGEHTVELFLREDGTWLGDLELVKQ
ncbi:MAG: RICIN domain-containing protein [Acidimicrobiales bacterium]